MATTTPTFHGLTRTEALAIIWRNTHNDFRSGKGLPRSILTTAGIKLLENLSDDEIQAGAAYGIRYEKHKAFAKQGLTVHTIPTRDWCGAVDQEGRAFVVNLITGAVRKVSDHSDKATYEERLTAAFLASEAESDKLAKAATRNH